MEKWLLSLFVVVCLSSLNAQNNRIGLFHGAVFTYGFDQDLKEFHDGLTNEPFNDIYEKGGKNAFRTGIGFKRGIFYERKLSNKSGIQLNIYHTMRRVVSDYYYYGFDPSSSLNGGIGCNISLYSYAASVSYRHKLFSKEDIFSVYGSLGFGVDNFTGFSNFIYIVSEQFGSLNYVKSVRIAEDRLVIDPKYFKYLLPIGVRASYNFWKGFCLDLNINYTYLTKGNYISDSDWGYFEDPLHTLDINLGIGHEF